GGHAASGDCDRGRRDRPGADECGPGLGARYGCLLAHALARSLLSRRLYWGLLPCPTYEGHATFRDHAVTRMGPAAAGSACQSYSYIAAVDPPPWAAMIRRLAPVAELVDAAGSKSVGGDIVLVRVRPGAPKFPKSYWSKVSRFRAASCAACSLYHGVVHQPIVESRNDRELSRFLAAGFLCRRCAIEKYSGRSGG